MMPGLGFPARDGGILEFATRFPVDASQSHPAAGSIGLLLKQQQTGAG
jgi:hypothetical protein